MGFREKMKVPVSRAEVQVALEFSKRMMTYGFQSQIGFTFTVEETAEFHVYGTVVDGIWPSVKLIYFLDGQPHLKTHALLRDAGITACLEKRGWLVLRFKYNAPISHSRILEVADAVQNVLRMRGYFRRLTLMAEAVAE